MTAVEQLIEQLTSVGVLEIPQGSNAITSIITQALEIEKEQLEKYEEIKEVLEDIIQHLDQGRILTLRKDSIIIEALRNSINKK